MPRVPSPSVTPNPLPIPQTRGLGPESFGAGLGGAVSQAAGAFTQFVEQEREKHDTARILDFQTQLDGLDHDLVANGALTKRGKDAMPVYGETMSAYDKATSEMISGLANDRQKQAASALVTRRRGQIQNTLEAHTLRESNRYNTEVAAASELSAANLAIQYASDPTRRAEAIKQGEGGIVASGAVLGQDGAVVESRLAAFRSGVHVGVIDRLLAGGQDLTAASYLKEYRGEIDGARLAQVEAAVEQGNSMRQAFEVVDRVYATAKTREEAHKEITKIENPKVRQAAQAELNQRYAEQDADHRAAEEQLFQSYSSDFAAGTSLRSLQSRPGWLQLDHNSREALIAADERRLANLRGKPMPSDPIVLTGFYLMSKEDKAKLSPLRDLQPYLSPSDYEAAVKQIGEARNAAQAADADGTQTLAQQTKSLAQSLGLVPRDKPEAKWDANEAQRYVNLQRQVDNAVQGFRDEHKRNPSPTERQVLLDGITTERLRVGAHWWGGGDQVPVSVLTDEDIQDLDTESLDAVAVPANQAAALSNLLRSSGRSPTRKDVVRLYFGALRRDPSIGQELLGKVAP